MAETEVATPKISSTKLYEALDAVQAAITRLDQINSLHLRPDPLRIYKPQPANKGAALKFDLRLTPEIDPGGFVKKVDGGLFVEIVAQQGEDDKGNATFGWQDADTKLVAKLGLPDITALLVALRCRWSGRHDLLQSRKKDKEGNLSPNTISLFHKFQDDNTVIEYGMSKTGGIIQISKKSGGDVQRRSIKVTISEEILVEKFLDHSLTMFLLVGKR